MGAYCIKDEYTHRTVNATVESKPGDYWSPYRMRISWHDQWADYEAAGQLVREKKLKAVLDVGSGMAHKLMTLVAPHADVTGVDQATAVAEAQKIHPQGRFIADDLEKPAKCPLGSFDLILSFGVIEHLLNPDILLNYIKANCRPDTLVMLSTVDRDVRRGAKNTMSPKAEHVREWSSSEFAAYLRQSGFEVLKHELNAPFRIGWSWPMIQERLRMVRKGIPFRYNQLALCRPAKG